MVWDEKKVNELLLKQREYFNTGETLSIDFRIKMLRTLEEGIRKYEDKLVAALEADLARSKVEAYLTDIGDIYIEINETIRNIRRWARPEKHFSGLLCFPSIVTKVYKMPYGVTLIISPFNFPIYLSFAPLVQAISAGNTAIIKASSKSPNCTKVMVDLVDEFFDEKYIKVVDGGHDVADMLLNERFDKIFYTGSPKVGKHVMECASKNLTSVALELGGETGNWCIVRKDADLRDAARKIAFFKILNAGQICININQVAIAKEVASEFLKYLKEEYDRQIGKDSLNNSEYPRLIGKAAYDKCLNEANEYMDRVVYGGKGDEKSFKFEPTIIYPVGIDESIVKHELFSPLLPIVEYEDKDVDLLLKTISEREHGLALYVFTKDMAWANKVMSTMQYGGGCINEVCVHLMVKGVPFNGTGHSGMGAYHGIWGFREFSHPQTVLKGSSKFNLPLREHPYDDKKFNLIKKFER